MRHDDDNPPLNRELNNARVAQGLSWPEFARRVGISEQALLNLRLHRTNPRDNTVAAVERAAGWAPGSFERVRNGGSPLPLKPDTPPHSGHSSATITGADDSPAVVGERLTWLLTHVRRDKAGATHTPDSVAEALTDDGTPTTAEYIAQLADGTADPPGDLLRQIAGVFKVDPSYFFSEETAEAVQDQIQFLNRLQDDGIRKIATRSVGLSEKSQKAIIEILDNARKLEDLPPVESED